MEDAPPEDAFVGSTLKDCAVKVKEKLHHLSLQLLILMLERVLHRQMIP